MGTQFWSRTIDRAVQSAILVKAMDNPRDPTRRASPDLLWFYGLLLGTAQRGGIQRRLPLLGLRIKNRV